jgi:DNA topoisomerase-2
LSRDIKKLTDREHILLRIGMYAGSPKPIKEKRYLVEDNKFVEKEITYIPALVKIVEEIIDNSVDAFVDTGFQNNPKLKITLEKDYFIVEDNGPGIPNKKIHNEWMCEVAWGEAKAGSNFEGERKSAGQNGVGSYLTNVLSKKFIGENHNNEIKVICKWNDNARNKLIKEGKTSKTGVKVEVWPDFERFNRKQFSPSELKVLEARIKMLALTYPEIKFYLNGKLSKVKEIQF